MIYGQILAGGSGQRMGNSEMPKQYLSLDNKPIIIHTLEQFILNKSFDKIIICCPKEWISHTRDIIKTYIKDDTKIDVCQGGSTRNETLMAGLEFIEKNYGLNDDDIVVTHDAVRPFLNQRLLNENIEEVKKIGATNTVVPATDTIVESQDSIVISNIPNRQYLYHGQSPQSFNIKKLMHLYGTLSEEEKAILTDACKIFVIKGEPVTLIKGDVSNIKITTPYDLKLASAIIKGDKL